MLILALVVAGAQLTRKTRQGSTAQTVGVPAYFYPAGPNLALWDKVRSGYPAVGIAIATGLRLEGAEPDPAYQEQIRRTHDAGIRTLAYVTTRNGASGPTRSAAEIEAEILKAYAWYGREGVLDGVFFDEAVDYPVTCNQQKFFSDLDGFVKAQGGPAITVINHGEILPECYADVSDIMMNAETTYASYKRTWRPWGWERDYPATKFWHIVHTTPSVRQMREVVSLSRERNAGTVFVTDRGGDGAPYESLPNDSFWSAELALLSESGGRERPPTTR